MWIQNCGDAWGKHEPEKGKPVKAEERDTRKNRCLTQSRERSENKVAKHVSPVPRKAAIAIHIPVPQTDTGGKGENPKAGGGSIAKELGKMAP